VILSPGERNESTRLEAVLDGIRVAHPEGSAGRPRKGPDHLIADKGYSYGRCRELLRKRGAFLTGSRSAVTSVGGERAALDASPASTKPPTRSGRELPGGGGHRLVDDLVSLMNRQ
jgi:Transposase DDE domain